MPVYNEGANISRSLAEIAERLPLSKRVLVVNDFDGDDGLPALLALATTDAWVAAVKNTLVRGVLYAIRPVIAATSGPGSRTTYGGTVIR